VCVMRGGDQPCPEPWTDRRPLYERGNVIDTRTCSSCSCSAPLDGFCAAEVSLYSSVQCNFSSAQVQSTGACTPITPFGLDALRVTALDPPTGNCVPAGGDPMGTLAPGEAEATVCCLPPRAAP
jgi:hypothetical protein